MGKPLLQTLVHRPRAEGTLVALREDVAVQLWWGSFDLAYCRFSGRLPEAEHAAAGFWPGDKRFPHAAFYAYTSPKPEGIDAAAVEPGAAFWSTALGEFLLPYDSVRTAADPRAALLAFLESTYRAGAERGGWDSALEVA